MITIIGLGVARNQISLEAAETLKKGGQLYLRTERHPAAEWLSENGISYVSFDNLYNAAEDFDTLCESIAETLLSLPGDVTYAVPGDGVTYDASARLLCQRTQCRILPGIGLSAQALSLCGGAADSLRILPAYAVRDAVPNVRETLVIGEIQTRLLASEVKLRLLESYPDSWQISMGDKQIPLASLDRLEAYDHLTCAVVPALPVEQMPSHDFPHLLAIMERLRDPVDGCPWDVKQTHASIRPSLFEEACEVADAIDREDPADMAEELGDYLLQVVFHAQIGKETGEFDIQDVLNAICEKMIRRHPHIFGDVKADTAEQVLQNWENIKRGEKDQKTTSEAMEGIPKSFPALLRAQKVQKKASHVGFDWKNAWEASPKIDEELSELLQAEEEETFVEAGDLLFAAVNVVRLLGQDAETALQAATDKFQRRFAYVEAEAAKEGKNLQDMTLPEMDVYWERCKTVTDKTPNTPKK